MSQIRIAFIAPDQSQTEEERFGVGAGGNPTGGLAEKYFGKKLCFNLGLRILAALTPKEIPWTVYEEPLSQISVRSVTEPIVALTGIVGMEQRMKELANQFRKAGRMVIIGGPYATMNSDVVRPWADVLFIGEAESTWPRFCQDLLNGNPKPMYRSEEFASLLDTPMPDLRALNPQSYIYGTIQSSRGCPYKCEFCDAIIVSGNKSRAKALDQFIAEVDALVDAGFSRLYIVDDNFTVPANRCQQLLKALADRRKYYGRRSPTFHTSGSVDFMRQDGTLSLMRAAGFESVFMGIETPNLDSLAVTRKFQNMTVPLADSIRDIQAQGILVVPGLVIGFDADGPDIFNRQYEFIQEIGTPIFNLVLLEALPHTPLFSRLQSESRLLPLEISKKLKTNIVPAKMTVQQLIEGFQRVFTRLWSVDAVIERIKKLASIYPRNAYRVGPRVPLHLRDYLGVLKLLDGEVFSRRGLFKDCLRIASLTIEYPHMTSIISGTIMQFIRSQIEIEAAAQNTTLSFGDALRAFRTARHEDAAGGQMPGAEYTHVEIVNPPVQ